MKLQWQITGLQAHELGIFFFEIGLKRLTLSRDSFSPNDFVTTGPKRSTSSGACKGSPGASSKVGFSYRRHGGPSPNNEAVPATASIDSGKWPGRTIPPFTAPWYRVSAAESRLPGAVGGL